MKRYPEDTLLEMLLNEFNLKFEEYLGTQFSDLPIYSRKPDMAGAKISIKNRLSGKQDKFYLAVYEKLHPSQIPGIVSSLKGRHFDELLILGAPNLSWKTRKLLRDSGISYIDLNGGFHLKYKVADRELNIIVDRQTGFKYEQKDSDRVPLSLPGVSRGRAAMYRTLLALRKDYWGVKELSAHCGLSPGGVSNYLEELVNAGWVERTAWSEFRLMDASGLLDYWAQMAKRIRLSIRGYAILPGNYDWLKEKVLDIVSLYPDVYHTLWSGAEFYGHFMESPPLALYCSNPEMIRNKFKPESYSKRIIGHSKNGLLWLIRSPDKMIGVGSIESDKERAVCWQQVYVDLANAPFRGKNIGWMLREEMER